MITVVSGLPRSGTSLMMRMLAAGGLPLLADDRRLPDSHNPHGYFEYAPVKRIDRDASWLGAAEGRAVKIVSPLLRYLPQGHGYRVILMRRPLREVLASQAAMLGRPQGLASSDSESDLRRSFANHQTETARWLRRQGIPVLRVGFHEALARPLRVAARVAGFVGCELNAAAMAAAVEAGVSRYAKSGRTRRLTPAKRKRERR